jgi:hypothetical protein
MSLRRTNACDGFLSSATQGSLSPLSQAELYRQVSRATGDPVAEIARRGFVPFRSSAITTESRWTWTASRCSGT